jgi:hypothetical protein
MNTLTDASRSNEHGYTVGPIDVDLLRVDPEVQRDFNEARVQKIVDEFSTSGLGVIVVSIRADGVPYVVDGQHRLLAVRRLPRETAPRTLTAEIFTGIAREDEALLFRLRNNAQRPSPLESFRVEFMEGNSSVHAMEEILNEVGRSARSGQDKYVSFHAVTTLRRLYDRDPDNLQLTLKVINQVWGRLPESTSGTVLSGFADFLYAYRETFDMSSFLVRLGSPERGYTTPENLLIAARALRPTLRRPLAWVVSYLLVDVYNYKLIKHVLPDWMSVSGVRAAR